MRNSKSLPRTLWGAFRAPRIRPHEYHKQEEQPPYQLPGQGTTYGACDLGYMVSANSRYHQRRRPLRTGRDTELPK
jgi:hypothetical protein